MNSSKQPCPAHALQPGWFCMPRLTRIDIDGAPDWLWGVQALFVSDVHLRRWVSDEKLSAFIALLADVRADLLLLGGDYAESRKDCRRFFHALGHLSFPLGAYGVPGNNDFAMRDELQALASEAGVTLLVNEVRQIDMSGGTLAIAGCDEYKYGKPRTTGLFPDDSHYRILLSHYPAPPSCSCELMLSGHTHGGQICPSSGLTPYKMGYERKYHLLAERGLHRVSDMRLLVSSGVGVSKLPLRLNAPGEIHLLHFQR